MTKTWFWLVIDGQYFCCAESIAEIESLRRQAIADGLLRGASAVTIRREFV